MYCTYYRALSQGGCGSKFVSESLITAVNIKLLNFWTPKMCTVVTLEFIQGCFFLRQICPKDADGMANSVDDGQTSSRSSLDLAKACLSKH